VNSTDTSRLRILVVEDDTVDRKNMERLLSRSRVPIDNILCVDCLAKTLTLLAERPPDILLLDLNLPDSAGLGTLDTLEKSHPNVPKIVVTGEGNEELGLLAVAKGAQDYLVKGSFDAPTLVRAINYSIERKKSEEALRENRGKLNAILESLNDPILMIDKDLNVVWSNEATKTVFAGDVLGKKCYQIYAGRDAPCEPGPCIGMEALRDGKPHSCDVSLIDRQGVRRYFHCMANVALRDKEDHPAAVIEIANDITDRKIAEFFNERKRMEAANQELKAMQSQLFQSEKLASIGQLAAGVAHEMNTPVGFVACNFETLESYLKKILTLLDVHDQLAQKVESGDKTERLETFAKIKELKQQMHFDFILKDLKGLFDDSREGLERVTEIIQSLRDFSRVDQTHDFARYNINEGLTATLTVARNEIKYSAEVKTEFADIPDVFCNPGQINQVFLNVLVNAAQAIESQERREPGLITIRTYHNATDVVCEIEDDGPGIPPESLRKVFDPFFTTKPSGKGTGLGLSVSYDIIVNKHKGQILVESATGHGTLFTIRLPINGTSARNDMSQKTVAGVMTNG
jgi:signal transduction histidine kinase/CheY-like chemotaxis protein